MKYYVSTIADVVTELGDDDWERLSYTRRTAPLAKENGLGIEISEFSISDNMDYSFDDVLPHIEYCASMAEEKTLHAPYNELYPMAIDRKVAAIAWDRYSAAYEYCKRFGASKMIVHANYYEGMYYRSWFTSRHVDFWKRFLKEHQGDIIVCIENVGETDPNVILDILKAVDDPRLRMCLDIGHANLSDIEPIEWLKICAPYISHYHLHNNDGAPKEGMRAWGDKHAALSKGNIDMKALLDLAEKLTPDATAAIESYQPEESVQWLKEMGYI